jgi:hypothetical protein
MTRDLGVWTADDCALVLIDYQKEMFEVIRSETGADLVELHVRLLAKTAKAFDMPIVLSTVGVGYRLNGPTLPSIQSELDGIEAIENVVLLGPPGTGKTHLAIALGIRACLAGHRVAFRTATEWVALLADAQRHGRLDTELDKLQRIPLLVVDEVGYG